MRRVRQTGDNRSVWEGPSRQATQESAKPQHSRSFQRRKLGRGLTQRSPQFTCFALDLSVSLAGGGEVTTQLRDRLAAGDTLLAELQLDAANSVPQLLALRQRRPARIGWPARQVQRGITPEIAAAVAKLMSNKDLVLTASKVRNITRCRNTMGQRGVLGIIALELLEACVARQRLDQGAQPEIPGSQGLEIP